MVQYAIFVFFLLYVASAASFLFPDSASSNSRAKTRYDDEYDYDNSDSYEYPSLSHHRDYNDGYNEYYHSKVHEFSPTFGNQPGHQDRYGRPVGNGCVTCKSQAHAQSSGSGSTVNSQSGAESSNDFSQSYANAGSCDNCSPYDYRPSGPGYPLGGSSAASATSAVVNGLPVASASAATASSFGSASAAASSSSISGGFANGPGQLPPWFFRSRIAGDEAGDKSSDETTIASVNDDKIVFDDL